uniref:Uncharacterized protein n=1 Tax=Opuntia streptacantha TaxID=393608 RepID=A0A7C9CSF2_OPUST
MARLRGHQWTSAPTREWAADMGMGGVGRWAEELKQRRRFGVFVVVGHTAFGRRRDAMAAMQADDDGSDDGHGATSSPVTEFMEKEMETAQVKQRRQGNGRNRGGRHRNEREDFI